MPQQPFQPAMVMPEPPAPPKGPPDYDAAWKTWSGGPRTPQANAQFLQTMDPLITQAARTHLGGGEVNPLAKSRARMLTLQAMQSYDPNKGRVQSHVYSHLQRLKRYNAQATAGVHVPERVVLDRRAVDNASQELADRFGREPTENELADHSGFSVRRIRRVRGFNPAMSTGYFAGLGEDGGGYDPAVRRAPSQASDAWEQLVFDNLDPIDNKIVEYDRAGYSNQQIARKLRRTAGAISHRTLKIQQMMDREAELNPF